MQHLKIYLQIYVIIPLFVITQNRIKKINIIVEIKFTELKMVHTWNATLFNVKMFVLDFQAKKPTSKVIFISSAVENYQKVSF